MKMLLGFLFLVHVSQHPLALVVEVHEGESAAQLPCLYSGFTPEDDPTVTWTRRDLSPKTVHLLRGGGEDVGGQNERYRGRTSMRPDALHAGDFSLTLRRPQLTDSSSYTCSIADGRRERRVIHIHLRVKDQQEEVKVEEGPESCRTTPGPPVGTRLEWTCNDMVVHVYPTCAHVKKQGGLYRTHRKIYGDLLRTGDLSLTLKLSTQRDAGGYICTFYSGNDILRQKVEPQVKETFPSWAEALLVLLVLFVVSGGFLFHFRHNLVSVWPVKVEVEKGAESVHLPFKTTKNLPEDIQVLWDRYDPFKNVHVYQNGSDQPDKQSEEYRGRTRINEDPLKTGVLSLTLMRPTEADSGEYKCLVWRRGDFIRKKRVLLTVRGRAQVQDQTEAAPLAPLMADQFVCPLIIDH